MINPEVKPKKRECYIKSVDNTVEMGLFLVKKYTCVYMNMCIHMCVQESSPDWVDCLHSRVQFLSLGNALSVFYLANFTFN